MQRIASPFDGFRQLKRRGSAPKIITQVSAPTFGPYEAGDTPAGEYVAGSYASTAGTIASAVPSWTINGVSQPGSTVLVEGDVVGLTVLVTDSAANTRTFGYGTTFVSSSGDTTPPEMTSFSYTAPMATAIVNETGKVWYLVNTSATLLSGVSIKALVQAMTPLIYGEFPVIVGDTDEPIDSTGLAPGDYWLHAVPEDDAGNVAAMGQAVPFPVAAAGWNLVGASYSGKSFSTTPQDASGAPNGIYIAPNGLDLYVTTGGNDDLHQYVLGTAWDITTRTWVRTFTGIPGNQITDVVFKPDGTKCYIAQNSTDSVYEFTLSTPWDISTMVLSYTLDISPTESAIGALFISPDGLNLYIVGIGSDGVEQYSFGTAWNLSTATWVRTFLVGTYEINPQGMSFRPDGTFMYILGSTNNTVLSFALSTPWNISTATPGASFSVAAQSAASQALFFRPNGLNFYVGDSTTASIYQYEAA